jgi:2-oxoglutarate ferredoxin oxidoreductase subunit delta
MTKVVFDEEKCKGCELCVQFCPRKVIVMADRINAKGYHPAVLADEENCISLLCVLPDAPRLQALR